MRNHPNKKKVKYDYIVISILVVLFFAFYYIFAKRGIGHHDFRGHAIFAGEMVRIFTEPLQTFIETTQNSHILAYPGWHIFFILVATALSGISKIIGMEISGLTVFGMSVAVVNTAFLLGLFIIIRRILAMYIPQQSYWRSTLLSAALLFVGPIYVPVLFDSYYFGLKTGSIWHNPTYLAVKPVAVLIFFMYVDIFNSYKKNKKRTENKKLILAGALLCISAVLKPSFFQMFLPALFFYCLFELLKNRGKNFSFLFKIGLSVVPVTLIGIFQIIILGGSSGGGSGISIGFLKVWSMRTPYWYIALILSLAFPLFVFAMRWRHVLNSYAGRLGIAALLSGMLQYMCLYVTKAPDFGDFGWGFALAIFLTFIVAVIHLERWRREQDVKKSGLKCAYILLGLHILCGLVYFYDIFKYLEYTLPLQL